QAAAESAGEVFKTMNVVALPAVYGDWDFGQARQRFFDIDAVRVVNFARDLKSSGLWHVAGFCKNSPRAASLRFSDASDGDAGAGRFQKSGEVDGRQT